MFNQSEFFLGKQKCRRSRNIPISSPAQRQILQYIKTVVKKGEKVGWCDVDGTPFDLETNVNKYKYRMKKFGMTKCLLPPKRPPITIQKDHALLVGQRLPLGAKKRL